MKKFNFLLSIFLLTAGGISAQMTVQGVPYENPRLANSVSTISAQQVMPLSTSDDFTFDDIEYWVGEGENEAALVVQWNDDRESVAWVWGYRWDGEAYGDEMVKAIAEADPRFYTLLGGPSGYGYTIGGLGYDLDNDGDIVLLFEGAEYDASIGYYIKGNTAYDYDSWSARDQDDYWQSGWYSGFWSYWIKDDASSSFSYASVGASMRKLVNGSWDGWNYEVGMQLSEWKPFAAAPETESSYDSGFLFSSEDNTINYLSKKGKLEYDVYATVNNAAVGSNIVSLYNFGGYTYILTKDKLIAANEKTLLKSSETDISGYKAIVGVAPSKLYLYGENGIAIYDATSHSIEKTFLDGNNVKQIVVGKAQAYILQEDKLSIYDTETDAAILNLSATYEYLMQDSEGCVWGLNDVTLDCLFGDKAGTSVALSSMALYSGTSEIVAHAQENLFFWISGKQIIRFNTDNLASVNYPFFSCEAEDKILTTLCIDYKEGYMAIFAKDTIDNTGTIYLIDVETGDLLSEYDLDRVVMQCIRADIAPTLFVENFLTYEVNGEGGTYPVTASDIDNSSAFFTLTATVDEDVPFMTQFDGSSLTINPKAEATGSGSIVIDLISNGRTVEKVVSATINRSMESFAFTTDSLTINSCDTIAPEILFYPENTTDTEITLKSSSTTYLQVADNNIVGLRSGTAKIYATATNNSNLKDTLVVTVNTPALDSVYYTRDTVTLLAGAKDTVMLSYLPTNASKNTTFTILDTNIATVSRSSVSSWDYYYRAIITGKAAGTTTLQCVVADTNDTLRIPVVVQEIPVTGMTLSEHEVDLVAPNTVTLTVSVTPSDATTNTAMWYTSDANIAKISRTSAYANCTVTAVSEGRAVITAASTDGGYEDSCIVNVTYIPLDSFKIAVPEASQYDVYESGNTFTAEKTFYPSDASSSSLTWSSSNTSLATCSSGYVSFKSGGGGTVVIKAVSNENSELQDSLVLMVVDTLAATSFALQEHEMYLKVNKQSFLYRDLEPSNAKKIGNVIKYTSDDEDIATVGSTGYVKGVSVGDTWVHASITNLGLSFTDSCLCHIVSAIEGITVSAETAILTVGDTLVMTSAVYPETAIPTVTWSSTDRTVASVSDEGIVTALKAGTTIITATSTDDTSVIGSFELTVEDQLAETLSLSIETDSLQPGEKLQLTVEVLPDNTTNKRVWWSSSNPDVATVSSNGIVEAIADGTAVITAASRDNLMVTSSCVIYVSTPVSALSEKAIEGISIYLSDNVLHIIGLEGEAIGLYNNCGQLLKLMECNTPHETVEISLTKGIYILKTTENSYKIVVR